MTEYAYVATDRHNTTVTGKVEAPDRSGAISELIKKKLRPLSVRDAAARTKGDIPLPKFMQSTKVKTEHLVTFTRQLATMVGAGVPLLRALESLQQHGESETLKKVVGEIYHDIQGGMALADALEKHPKVFNDIYVNMVRAGETAGILDDIMKRLAVQQEKSSGMKKKIKSAMTYPMVLIVIAVGAFFGLMIFVIPQIGKVIQGLAGPDAKLPALTQFMMNVSHIFVAYWYIVFPIVFGVIFVLMRFLKTKKGRSLLHHVALKIPGINVLITKVAVARFARTFSALMGAGVSVLEALSVTAKGIGNEVFEQALTDAIKEVKGGAQLSVVIGKNPIFPPIVAQMLSVGEETGQTDQVLVKVADFYDEEVDVAIDGMSSIIEPIMIVFMGGMVGVIAVSVLMPIMNMSSYVKD
jgi:Type II secretory pathway, component PulF